MTVTEVQAVLAVEAALADLGDADALLAKLTGPEGRYRRLNGAHLADVLSIVDDADERIEWTEPFYEGPHAASLSQRYAPVLRFAVLAAALEHDGIPNPARVVDICRAARTHLEAKA